MASTSLSEASGPPWTPSQYYSFIFEEGVKANPHGDAFICMHQDAHYLSAMAGPDDQRERQDRTYLAWTYTQMERAVNRLCSAIAAKGVQPGQSMAVLTWSRVEWGLCMWAAAKLRLVFVPLDPRTLERAEETRNLFGVVKPAVVVVEDVSGAKGAEDWWCAGRDDVLVKLVCEGNGRDHPPSLQQAAWSSFEAFASKASPSFTPLPGGTPTDLSAILFTSGTTSRPKGCTFTSQALEFLSQGLSRNLTPPSRVPIATASFRAICHGYAMNIWRAGGTCIFASAHPNPAAHLDALVAERGTYAIMVPSSARAVIALLNQPGATKPAHLELVTIGGDISAAPTLRRTKAAFGARRALNGWGMTEGGSCAVGWPPRSDFEDLPGANSDGVLGIGYVLPGHSVRVCELGTRNPVPRGVDGEMHLHGPGIIDRYLEDRYPEMWYVDEQGRRWFRTGDRTTMGEDGVVTILGRYKDAVNKGGVMLSPGVFEGILNSKEGVGEAQVVSIPHEHWGSVPVAVVRPTSPDALPANWKQALREAIVKGMGEEAALEDVLALEELGLDAFPINGSGKVMKDELQKRIEERGLGESRL
ncbi:acetyl-CoA synthetase-like protein [Saccharata proteae CBS 121410]|uniref:Long-chain-fatty-acid--CoA ligase n=1 Tax=Saccharata proteae CBS 121410 TaxID=1314787 RepID=A0A9P4HTW0_9PEZI|nr:acetyl-CoA synthetase-like protein [Saccharata proteae CBS 121410]